MARRHALNSQYFMFETGQETPVTLTRAIEDIALENLGVNLDPANLLMYGMAYPCDALLVIGQYVRGVHCIDGMHFTNGHNLGEEKALGEGLDDFRRLIGMFEKLHYEGDYTIER